jgi:hypothetical protein
MDAHLDQASDQQSNPLATDTAILNIHSGGSGQETNADPEELAHTSAPNYNFLLHSGVSNREE